MGNQASAQLDTPARRRRGGRSGCSIAPAPGAGAPWVVLAACLIMAGCGASTTKAASASASAPTTLRVATSFAIDNLDPLQNGFWGSEMGFGDLLMKPEGNGKLTPWLLQSLDRTSPEVWTLTLRPGISFQDGDPLDASALAQTMNFMLANNTSLEPALPGATVAATGPLTVTLTTAKPAASVPSLLANESMFDIFDTPVYLRLKSTPDALVAARIYTGPYTPVSLSPQRMVMSPTQHYYGPTPKLKQLTILFVADAQARIDAVEHGEADVALYPPTSAARQLTGRTDAFFITQQSGFDNDDFDFIMNLRSGPLSDVAVRQAIQHGIDYQQIAKQVMRGYYDTPAGLYPPLLPYALKDQRTDTSLAETELQNDGWVIGPGGIRTKGGRQLAFTLLTYPQQPDTAPIALAMQSELRPIGIDMQIKQVSDIDTTLQQPSGWDAALSGDTAMDWTDSDPVEPLIAEFTSKGDDNYGGIDNPQIDQIGTELEASESTSQTNTLLEQAQRIIVEQQAYLIVISYKRDPVIASPALRNYVVPHAALLWTNAYA